MDRKHPQVIPSMVSSRPPLPAILKGRVVSVNDPQQDGRLLVHFPALGTKFDDSFNKTSVDHYKWIQYASVYGGETSGILRGPASEGQGLNDSGSKVEGKLAYGFWAIPTVGATVFCFTADGDYDEIYWFACKYPPKSSSTLFGGKYAANGGEIDGPLSHSGQPVEPLYSNQRAAFGGPNYEWLSRAASYNPGAVLEGEVGVQVHPMRKALESSTQDTVLQSITEGDGSVVGRHMKYTPGYARSRLDPAKVTNTQHDIDRSRSTPQNSESTMVGISTPAGATLNFDDRPEACRTLVRSVSGHSVILDDTNDRVYISTNKGNNWIELDANGHIFVYSSESISCTADGDINFTAEKTMRLWGKKGIHLVSTDGDIRSTSKNIHNDVEGTVSIKSADFGVLSQSIKLSAPEYHVKTTSYVVSTSTFSVDGSSIQIKGSGINLDGSSVNIKGSGAYEGVSKAYNPGSTAPPASTSTASEPTEPEKAFWTNITPKHEPWARTFNGTKGVEELFDHTPEHGYDDPSVNREMTQNVQDYERGPLWRR